MAPKKTSTERVKRYQKKMKEQKAADNKLMGELCRAFPGQLRAKIEAVHDFELGASVQMRIFFPSGIKPALAAFALERDIDIYELFDRVMRRGINNLATGQAKGSRGPAPTTETPDPYDRMERL